MKLGNKKKLAAKLLKVGVNRVWFDQKRLDEIKEAITRADVKRLINDLAIQAKPKTGISSFRTKKIKKQKRKGKRKGYGSRKGKESARSPSKKKWMANIRIQRILLKKLRNSKKLSKQDYKILYQKAKGGFFRSKRHIKLYIEEHNLIKK